jgi:hypothetical protein
MADARQEELNMLVQQTGALINDLFANWSKPPDVKPTSPATARTQEALRLDLFSARCSQVAAALTLCSERAAQAAEELLDG